MDNQQSSRKTIGNGNDSVGSDKSYMNIFGIKQQKAPVVFLIQTLLIFLVVITALVNLSINTLEESDKKLWIILLSSCVGYILPNPSIKLTSLK